MNHINSVLLEGYVAQSPKLITTSSLGNKLVVFTMASNRFYYDKEENKKVETLFIEVSAWGQLGEKILQQIQLGTLVRVVGRLRPVTWTGKDGKERSSFQISAQHIEFKKALKEGKEQDVALEAHEEDEAREPLVLYRW